MANGQTHDAAAILAKLDEIESEMKAIGFWSGDGEAAAVGTFLEIPFDRWLQFVFLPNARKAAESRAWPRKSDVGLMALRQYDYHGTVPEALGLVRLLGEFDRLIEGPRRT